MTEAAAFVVFVRDPDGHVAAAVVDADTRGLSGELRPAGMGGWSWGILHLDQVPVDPTRDVLSGTGMGVDPGVLPGGRCSPPRGSTGTHQGSSREL